MVELAEILPAPVTGHLTSSMVPERFSLLRSALSVPVTYLAFEFDRERFAWLQDPAARSIVNGRFGDTLMDAPAGAVYWYLRLRQRQRDWHVVKAHVWHSPEAAREAAGMEWTGKQGYFVGWHDGRASLGPSTGDFADPAKYVSLLRRRSSPDDRS